MPVVGLAKTFRDLPERLQSTFVQLMTMSATEFLQQWFETDPLIATMSASGIIGTFQGVRSPGTAYVLLHHYMGEIDGAFRAWGIPRGGTGGISEAIASAARAAGVEIRTEAPVARIDVRNGRATGVVLESGEEIAAGAVLSSVDSHVTFLRLVEPSNLEPSFLEEVKRYKFRGSSGKVNLALDALPELACRPGRGEWLRGAISFSPGVDYMERAYDDAKYGRFSTRPYIDCIIPTLVDPSMAPPGKHVMSCFVQYAPYHLSDGRTWDDAERDAFGETVISTLEERFPNIRNLILHRQVLTPLDIERITGSPRATSSRASSRSSSCSSTGRFPDGPATGRRSRTCGCAARPRIRAAGSWARRGGSPRSSSWAGAREFGGQGRLMAKRYDAVVVGAGTTVSPRPPTSRRPAGRSSS